MWWIYGAPFPFEVRQFRTKPSITDFHLNIFFPFNQTRFEKAIGLFMPVFPFSPVPVTAWVGTEGWKLEFASAYITTPFATNT